MSEIVTGLGSFAPHRFRKRKARSGTVAPPAPLGEELGRFPLLRRKSSQ